jgi:hypothetical protein
MDRQILVGAARALRPSGMLILTAPNAAFMLSKQSRKQDFSPLTLRETFTIDTKNSNSEKVTLQCSQRYYTYPELRCLLQQAGFKQINKFAVTTNGYSNQEHISNNQFEFGVIAIRNNASMQLD